MATLVEDERVPQCVTRDVVSGSCRLVELMFSWFDVAARVSDERCRVTDDF